MEQKCDLCGESPIETKACEAKNFRVRGELISVLFGLFTCKNGHLFEDWQEYRTEESNMGEYQLKEFKKMKESKTHFTCCNGGGSGASKHYYDGECSWCDEGNERKVKNV